MSPGPMGGPPGGGPRGPRPAEHANDFGKAWGRLFRYMKTYRVLFVVAVAAAFIGTILTLVGPGMLSDITNLIEEGIGNDSPLDMDAIVSICVALLVIYLVSAVLTLAQSQIMAYVSQKTASGLRRDISRKINRLPLRYFDRTTAGDVMSRVTNDVDSIGQMMNQSISTLVTGVTLVIGSVVMMFYTNWILAVVAVLTTLLGMAAVMLIMSRSQKYFSAQQTNLGAMNGHVEEMFSGYKVVTAYNGQSAAREEFSRINDNLFRSAFRSQFMGGTMMPLMGFIGNLGYVLVCIAGAFLCLSGDISFGVIVAFIIYVRLFTQPLSQISQVMVSMQSVAAASERVFAFLDEEEMEPETDRAVRLDGVEGRVEFRDVRFGYEPGKEVIHGFSATVEPGQKVAIVGPTGAGKTTMVNLLMRFYELDGGDILIDGVSVRDMRREDVHDLFCMVLQDTWLFEGTLRENLVYSRPDVSEERLDEVCEAVGLKHYVETLPNGYDTVILDDESLSAGQRQQVTIARAMLDGSPLLILDEATSAVDTRTERVIQDAMDRLSERRTSFVIAHRLSTIRNSDLILVMNDGDIVEQGTHETLLAAGGFYADLYNSQFENRRGPFRTRRPASVRRQSRVPLPVGIRFRPLIGAGHVLEDVPRLAVQRVADRLEGGEPHTLHLPRLDLGEVDAGDADVLGQLLQRHLPVRHNPVQSEYNGHGIAGTRRIPSAGRCRIRRAGRRCRLWRPSRVSGTGTRTGRSRGPGRGP